jgi:hypothetical protein
MKSNTKNTKPTIYPAHEEWRKTYPSFIERGTSEQLASNKLDRSSGLGYHRTNGKVEHLERSVARSHITNTRNAHFVRSPIRTARKDPGLPVDSNVLMVMERPGDRDPQPEEPTSNKQSTSEQTLKHSGPGYTSNGRASKTIPQ